MTRDWPAAATLPPARPAPGARPAPARHGGAAGGPAGAALGPGWQRRWVLLGTAHGAAVRLRLLLQRAALGAVPNAVPTGAAQKPLRDAGTAARCLYLRFPHNTQGLALNTVVSFFSP